MECLLRAIDADDAVTGGHLRRVAMYSLLLAERLPLRTKERRSIERVALFHDIGKIHGALYDIVHSPQPLSAEERRAIATHPDRGAMILAPLGAFYPDLPDGVRSHHERWDGTGYPRGLRGDQIPLAARVVAVADSFDAITFTRRYHPAETVSDAVRALEEGRGTQFDPAMVDCFLESAVLEKARDLSATDATGQSVNGFALAPRVPERRQDGRLPFPESSAVSRLSFRWRESSDVGHDSGQNVANAESEARNAAVCRVNES